MNAEEPVELVYEITGEDVKTYYDDYNAYSRTEPRKTRRRRALNYAFFYIALTIVPYLCCIAIYNWSGPGLAFIGLIVSAYLWSQLLPRMWRDRYIRKLSKTPGFVGQHRLRIDAEGVTDRNALMAVTVFWPQITDVQVGKHHIMIFGGKQDWVWALPLPRHSFAGNREAKEFVERISGFWKSATVSAITS